jgi:ubiquinone/menaquinone biosynthesis C-methylase UbiE
VSYWPQSLVTLMAEKGPKLYVDTSKRASAETYDEASDIYDTYEGLFFPYLFGRIRELIEHDFIPSLPAGAKVLDIGCGTGQQTMLFKKKGFEVLGIDISQGLVRVANKKLGENICMVSDACHLPFPDGYFDAVSSAGSTVNHVPDYQCFFEEMCRVLKPGGQLFLESDNKWSPDMFWCLASTLVGDPLEYHGTVKEAIGYFKRPLHEGYPYVFPLHFDDNKVRLLNLRTFTYHEIKDQLAKGGCAIRHVYSVHSITNAIPSPIMQKDEPGRIARGVFSILRPLEDSVYRTWPFNRVGISIIVTGEKKL